MNGRVNMSAKDLHIHLKNGKGIEFLLKKYQLPDEEALFDVIRRVTPDNAVAFIKKSQKTEKKLAHSEAKSEGISQAETTAKNEVVEKSNEKEPTAKQQLLELQEEEKKISTWLIELETSHKALVRERSKVFDSLLEVKEKCMRWIQKVNQLTIEVDGYRKEYFELSQEIEKYNNEISVAGEILEDIRKKCCLLREVSVFIYDDGRIEIENGEEPEVSAETEKSLFDLLINQPEAEDFTVREVKSLVRVLLVSEQYILNGVKFELYFDNSKLQDYCNKATKEILH